jgi:hypothetical protein
MDTVCEWKLMKCQTEFKDNTEMIHCYMIIKDAEKRCKEYSLFRITELLDFVHRLVF